MKASFLYKLAKKILCTLTLIVMATACGVAGGGGGGGDDEQEAPIPAAVSNIPDSRGNPAKVRLNVDPRKIDAGDIMTVEIELSDITRPFILKIKHHENLVYMNYSMLLYAEDSSTSLHTTPKDFAGAEGMNYLVETIADDGIFGEKRAGRVILNFQGVAYAKFDLAVDVDEYNLSAPTNIFNPANPQFSALADAAIEIDDENVEQDDTDEEGASEEDTEESEEDTSTEDENDSNSDDEE